MLEAKICHKIQCLYVKVEFVLITHDGREEK